MKKKGTKIFIIGLILVLIICLSAVIITVKNQDKNFNGKIVCDVDGIVKEEKYKEIIEKIETKNNDNNKYIFSVFYSKKINQELIVEKNEKTGYRKVYDMQGNCILSVSGKGKMGKMKLDDMIKGVGE